MNYGRIPLYPGGCGSDGCMRVPLFGENCDNCRYGCGDQCQTVRVRNPDCPSEYADVELCVDRCGNLSVRVHRPTADCCSRDRKYRKRC